MFNHLQTGVVLMCWTLSYLDSLATQWDLRLLHCSKAEIDSLYCIRNCRFLK